MRAYLDKSHTNNTCISKYEADETLPPLSFLTPIILLTSITAVDVL